MARLRVIFAYIGVFPVFCDSLMFPFKKEKLEKLSLLTYSVKLNNKQTHAQQGL